MAKPTVFVVEDDRDVSRLVRHHLDAAGFATTTFSNGRFVIQEAERIRPSLFVLDVMVPGKDGLELCRTIRQLPSLAATPVIFLTARNSEADRILGLNLGADDYVSKPFSPRDLVARVKAVLRPFSIPSAPTPIRVGDIEINPSAMTLMVRDKEHATTATEFRLLDLFFHHIGRALTRNQILDSVWRNGGCVTSRSVDVYVRRVRKKIELDPDKPLHLKTVRGTGYRFDDGDKLEFGEQTSKSP